MSFLEEALSIALENHKGEEDIFDVHPMQVMARMSSEDEKIVALLHDSVRRTESVFSRLEAAGFPPRVLEALNLFRGEKEEPLENLILRVKENHLARRVERAHLEECMNLKRYSTLSDKLVLELREILENWRILTTQYDVTCSFPFANTYLIRNHGVYDSLPEASGKIEQLIRDWLLKHHEPGMAPPNLFSSFVTRGEEIFIRLGDDRWPYEFWDTLIPLCWQICPEAQESREPATGIESPGPQEEAWNKEICPGTQQDQDSAEFESPPITPEKIRDCDLRALEGLEPFECAEFSQLTIKASNGEVPVHFGVIPLNLIRPYDEIYSPERNPAGILEMNVNINAYKRGERMTAWVFYHRGHFVLARDYPVWAAAHRLRLDALPCYIIGDFSLEEISGLKGPFNGDQVRLLLEISSEQESHGIKR